MALTVWSPMLGKKGPLPYGVVGVATISSACSPGKVALTTFPRPPYVITLNTTPLWSLGLHCPGPMAEEPWAHVNSPCPPKAG
jgi:hypothetical protein